jgi:hypothetical protein
MSKTKLASSFLLMVVFTEAILRIIGFGDPPVAVLDPEVEYYVKPNSTFYRFGNRISSNELGMRAEPWLLNKPQKGNKVFIFGDSVVYGNHLLDQSEIVAYQLQKIEQPKKLQVYSVAASSWGPQNILAYIDKFGPFEGELAVIVQSSHDRRDRPFQSSSIVPYRLSDSWSALGDFISAVMSRLVKSNQPVRSDVEVIEPDIALTKLIFSLKKNFDHVLLIHHPTTDELDSDVSNNLNTVFYEKLAIKQGIYFSAASAYYKDQCDKHAIYRDYIHLSAEGTACLAKLIQKKARYISSSQNKKKSLD